MGIYLIDKRCFVLKTMYIKLLLAKILYLVFNQMVSLMRWRVYVIL